jgi:hypothetical protein
MWREQFRSAKAIEAVEKEFAPSLGLVAVVERDEVRRETEAYFGAVMEYLEHEAHVRPAVTRVRTVDLAAAGIVQPPVADHISILTVQDRQVAVIYECRDDPRHSLLIGSCDLTPELMAELQTPDE